MLGRGLIANPGLAVEITEGKTLENRHYDIERFKAFHDEVYAGYQAIQFGDRNILFKMKELWFYMQNLFPQDEKLYKKIRKAKSLSEYESIVKNALLKR